MSLDILVSKYQKKNSFSSKFFGVQNFFKVHNFFYLPWRSHCWFDQIKFPSFSVSIRVGDNYFWKLIKIWGPYGTQKGALGASRKKKKRFSKGGPKRIGIIWWVLLCHLGMKKSREKGKFDLIESAMRSPWNVKKVMDLKKFWTLKNFKENEFFFCILTLVYLDWSDDPDSFEPPFQKPFFWGGAPRGPLWSPLGASKCDKFQNFVVPCSYCVIWVWKIQRKREIHYWAEIT